MLDETDVSAIIRIPIYHIACTYCQEPVEREKDFPKATCFRCKQHQRALRRELLKNKHKAEMERLIKKYLNR